MKTMTVDELAQELDECYDARERQRVVCSFGKNLNPLPDEYKTEDNRVLGCAAMVWIVPEVIASDPKTIRFRADSNALVVKGLVAIVVSLINDRSPEYILGVDFESIFDRLQLKQFLLNSRTNGLSSMVQRVRDIANRCKSMSQP